jgi:hypothetical protein
VSETGFDLPVARNAKLVTPADTGTNCKGAIGIHNATATAGAVKVTLGAKAGGATVSLYLGAGAVLYVEIDNVWATPAPPASVVAFFG